MAIKRFAPLLAVGLMFSQALGQAHETCPDPTKETGDVVYAKQSTQDASYLATIGRIEDLTCDQLTMKPVEGNRRIYTRDAVQLVTLDSHCAERNKNQRGKEPSWEKLATDCWNSATPFHVRVADTLFPPIKPSELWKNYPRLADFLAAIILLSVLAYATYKLYDISFEALTVNARSREKLELEVQKLRYELESLKRQTGVAPEIAPETARADLTASFGARIREADVAGFLTHKLLGIPSETEARRIADRWQKKWQAYGAQGRRLVLIYQLRRVLNYLFTILAAVFCVLFLVDLFVVLSPSESVLTGWGMFGMFLFALLLFLISLRIWLRLNASRRIMRQTYLAARGLPV
jgi:hypothetical protein